MKKFVSSFWAFFWLLLVRGCASSESTTGGCTSKGCVEAAFVIIQQLDMSVDPCVDFYQFSCGRYVAETKPKLYQQWDDDYFKGLVAKSVEAMLKMDVANATSAEAKAIAYYNACTNKTAESNDDEASTLFLQDFLRKELRGFKMSPFDEMHPKWNLEYVLTTVVSSNGTALFQLNVEPDSRNMSRYGVIIEPETTAVFMHRGVVEKIIEVEEVKQTYVDFLRNLMQRLLEPEAEIEEAYLRDVVDFEFELAKITPPPVDLQPDVSQYNNHTETSINKYSVPLSQLEALSPAIQWKDLLRALGKRYDVSTLQGDLADLKISYRAGSYFSDLSTLLEETFKIQGEMAKRTLHNYITLKMITIYFEQLSCGYSVPLENLRKKIQGDDDESNTVDWCVKVARANSDKNDCVEETRQVFLALLARKFVSTYFPQSYVDYLANMSAIVRQEFGDHLKTVDWLDDATRAKAEIKLKNLLLSIGYPADLFTPTYDQRFDDLLVEDSYLANLEHVQRFSKQSDLQALDSPVDRDAIFWEDENPTDQNAFYQKESNSFGILAGYCVSPFFRPDLPPAYNWGRIATTIGHEFTHGFDNSGKDYDEFGEFSKWWTNQSEANFWDRAGCLVDQFAAYHPDISDYGYQILSENIADNGGLKIAFAAFQRTFGNDFLKKVEMPGLPYTNEQIYFLANAQGQCYSFDDEGKALLLADYHAFPPDRVNGMMLNFEAWANAFNCPVGSPMNPSNRTRCAVWS